MRQNVGGWDRTIRMAVGGLLMLTGVVGYLGIIHLAFGPFPQAITALVVFLLGAALIATGVTRRCKVNELLGRDTYRR